MSQYELSPDRPLISSNHDVLGTKPFAEQLAKALLSFRQSESLVIGLLGPWGSGKSTVLNFIAEYCESLPEPERPTIFSFNPWLFSSQEDLITLFLNELALKLNSKDYSGLVENLQEFADIFKGLNDTLSDFTGWKIPYLSSITGFLFKKRPKSLLAQKDKISGILKKNNRKIVVFIDDLDRLTPEEVRNIFKLIKAVCDFPNVLYIASFDKKVVSKALDKFHEGKGEEYLEKIIQVPFELPSIDQQSINNLFFEKLDQILAQPAFKNSDEQHYWSKVFIMVSNPI